MHVHGEQPNLFRAFRLTGANHHAMMVLTTQREAIPVYEIQITRAGRSMSHDQAAELIAKGYRVTVIAVSGPHSLPSDFWAEIMGGSGTDGAPRVRINFAPFRSLDAEGASTVSSVAVVAAEVAMKAEKLMTDRGAEFA